VLLADSEKKKRALRFETKIQADAAISALAEHGIFTFDDIQSVLREDVVSICRNATA